MTHPVLELIQQRLRGRSAPGRRSDNYRLGLAIEGGGMRGVVSAGMVAGLEQLGARDAFDFVYGASAGAVNAAYFVARQARFGTTIYYDNISNRKFINLLRIFSGAPVLSLEYLLDQVMLYEKRLDWRAVLDSPVKLKVVASSVSKLKAELIDDYTTRETLFEALRASARMPLIAGPPVTYGGDRYLDASLFDSIPFRLALADGCSHVLALRTRPRRRLRGRQSFLERRFIAPWLRRIHPGLADAFRERAATYAADVQRLERDSELPQGSPWLLEITPSGDGSLVGRLEKRRARLVEGAAAGMSAVMSALTGEACNAIEVLTSYGQSGHACRMEKTTTR